jgi:hypothetical protein
MPDYLRWGIRMVTFLFNISPILSRGKTFARLPTARRQSQILAWKHSRFKVKQDLVKFYESLAIFGWYSEA